MSSPITFNKFDQWLSDKYVIKPAIRIGFADLESNDILKIENIPDEVQGSTAGNAKSNDNQNLNRKIDHYVE